MSEKLFPAGNADYRVHITRETGQYRAFWFCPHADCFGSFRSDELCESRNEAFRLGTAAARVHQQEFHAQQPADAYYPEFANALTVRPILIHG